MKTTSQDQFHNIQGKMPRDTNIENSHVLQTNSSLLPKTARTLPGKAQHQQDKTRASFSCPWAQNTSKDHNPLGIHHSTSIFLLRNKSFRLPAIIQAHWLRTEHVDRRRRTTGLAHAQCDIFVEF
jgi:hypothetical protein